MVNKETKWTLEQIIAKLNEVKNRGFLPIPPEMYRRDEGIVGQILEREFNVTENNLSVRDLGDFELKGMRTKSRTLTLCHKTPEEGLTPIQIFDRFGYIRPSNRDTSVLKKKLFTTVNGTVPNSIGFILSPHGSSDIDLYFHKEFICKWSLHDSLRKIGQIILVLADTRGATASRDEQFHYVKAYLLKGLRPLNELVQSGVLVIDFCIDQEVNSQRGPHDRGPHIRIYKRNILTAYNDTRVIL